MRIQLLLAAEDNTGMYVGIIVIVAIAAIFMIAVLSRYFGLWIQCKMTGAGIGLANLIVMSIRKVNPSVIVRSKIMAVQAGLTEEYPISHQALEAHYRKVRHLLILDR